MAVSFNLLPEIRKPAFLQSGDHGVLSTSSPFYTLKEMEERDAIAMQIYEAAQTQIGSQPSSCSSSYTSRSEAIFYIPPERFVAVVPSRVAPSVKERVYAAVFETSDSEFGYSAESGVLGTLEDGICHQLQSKTATRNVATRNPTLTINQVRRPIGVAEEPKVTSKYDYLPAVPLRRIERSRGRTRSKTPTAEIPKRAAKPGPKRLAPTLIPRKQQQAYVRPPTLELVPKQRIVGFEIKPEDEHQLRQVANYRPDSEKCPGPINTPDFVGNASLSCPIDVHALHDKLLPLDVVPSPTTTLASSEPPAPPSAHTSQAPWIPSRPSTDSMHPMGLGIDLYGSTSSNRSPLGTQRSLDDISLLTTRRRSVSERLASYPSADKICEHYKRVCTPGFIARYEPLHPGKGGIRSRPMREVLAEESRDKQARSPEKKSSFEKSFLERKIQEASQGMSPMKI